MRTIKFRAWDNVDYMSTPFNLQDLQNGWIQFTSDTTILQFIGLLDKNGKEIYEGDILKSEELQVTIEFKAGQFVGVYQGTQGGLWGDLANRNWLQWEIIGNIYENAELLK